MDSVKMPNACHSSEGWNPVFLMLFWISVFMEMTPFKNFPPLSLAGEWAGMRAIIYCPINYLTFMLAILPTIGL